MDMQTARAQAASEFQPAVPPSVASAAWADAAERLARYRAEVLMACRRHGAFDVDLHGVVVMGPDGPEPDLMLVIHDALPEPELEALRRDLVRA